MNSESPVTPCPVKTPMSTNKMSSSLRERLKRSSRYFTSPMTPRNTFTRNTKVSVDSSPDVCLESPSSDNATNRALRLQFDGEVTTSPKKDLVTSEQCTAPTSNPTSIVLYNQSQSPGDDIERCMKIRSEQNEKSESQESHAVVVAAGDLDFVSLKKEQLRLMERVSEKEETLRKLNMVKTYRSKNDLNHLGQLVSKWQRVCQDALQDLWQLLDEPRPPMADLLQHLHIDHARVGYNLDDDSFT